MKYILHIDTSGDKCNIFISGNGKLLHQKNHLEAKNHASVINSLIFDVLQEEEIGLNDLSAIAIIGGPGSYTGLRIGLATAKGICYVNDLPLIMHNKLDLLAMQSLASNKQFNLCLAVLPARENEYFYCIHNKKEAVILPKHIDESELMNVVNNIETSTIATGKVGLEVKNLLQNKKIKNEENEVVNPDFWCQISFDDFNCNNIVNLANTEPFYLKSVYINK